MATFYTQVESNIRRTFVLITGFLVLIIGLGWLFSYILESPALLILAIFFALFQSFISYWYSDKIILAITRARPIEKRDSPELYRIVENLCITAGLPNPKIYVLNETQPNAFATGRDAEHSAIVVTKGLLGKLEKPELEGVIAHEISHVKNRDILLASVVVVLVGVVAILSNWFLRISYWRPKKREREGSGIFLIFGLIATILAPIVANLIQLAISRKREFLSDASAALLTRYPEGLARALEKISADRNSMRLSNPATSHLFIASPFRGEEVKNWITKLFLTHPPVEERIKTLREMAV